MKAPKAPDPAQTAAVQGSWNSFTAQQQQAMNMTGQNSPWGSLQYDQTGTQTIIDPNGNPIQVPRYTANTTLTPQQQAIFDQTQSADLNLATIANEQSGRIGELLNDPFKFENSDAEQWAYDLASPRLLTQQGRDQSALETQLVNAGIRRGTPQFEASLSGLRQDNRDQLNQLALTGRSQAFSEALAQRNQPLNEIIGLTSGTQIQNPNATFAATPQSQVAGVDYSGLVNSKYQSELQQHNAKVGAIGGALGGLFGMFKFSDARLKTNVKRIGKTDSGQPIYSYNYIWGGPTEIGVMAHETPSNAVIYDASGFQMVNYAEVK
ncbi:hypothetical protein [Microcystis phage Mwe-JY13]